MLDDELEEVAPVRGKCCSCWYDGEGETDCPSREDKTHCEHWWDGSPGRAAPVELEPPPLADDHAFPSTNNVVSAVVAAAQALTGDRRCRCGRFFVGSVADRKSNGRRVHAALGCASVQADGTTAPIAPWGGGA